MTPFTVWKSRTARPLIWPHFTALANNFPFPRIAQIGGQMLMMRRTNARKAHKLWDPGGANVDIFLAGKKCESTDYFGAFATTMTSQRL